MLTKANEIYTLLIENQITKNQGDITFDFLNISIKINEKSAVGDLFQEWLAEWMRQQRIKFRIKQNSQEFPDFLLDEDSNTKDLLEIKRSFCFFNLLLHSATVPGPVVIQTILQLKYCCNSSTSHCIRSFNDFLQPFSHSS